MKPASSHLQLLHSSSHLRRAALLHPGCHYRRFMNNWSERTVAILKKNRVRSSWRLILHRAALQRARADAVEVWLSLHLAAWRTCITETKCPQQLYYMRTRCA